MFLLCIVVCIVTESEHLRFISFLGTSSFSLWKVDHAHTHRRIYIYELWCPWQNLSVCLRMSCLNLSRCAYQHVAKSSQWAFLASLISHKDCYSKEVAAENSILFKIYIFSYSVRSYKILAVSEFVFCLFCFMLLFFVLVQ